MFFLPAGSPNAGRFPSVATTGLPEFGQIRNVALRSHYLFESQFTTPGIQGAHEKGGVEGEVGRFRRNHLVPVPQVADRAELNARLLADCEADLTRWIAGRQVTVGEAWAVERPLLRALPVERFDATEAAAPRVDTKWLVTVRQNRYSVPVALAGLRVAARIGAREITISHAGAEVARHERLHGKGGTSAQLSITTSNCWVASPAASNTPSRYPTAPPSSSSKSSANATNAAA